MTPREAAEMRADIMMARKEYSEGLAAYQQLIKDEPKNALLLNKAGVACQQLANFRLADRYYKKAIAADKNFSSPINNLGTIEYQRKHYSKSIDLYKKALVFQTDLAAIYSNLGYSYFADKQYSEAMESFGKALAIDPAIFEHKGGTGSLIQQRSSTDPGLFYFYLAKAYAQLKDAERAAHYLKMARDDGYKDYLSAQTDPAFANVIKDPRVQEVLQGQPPYSQQNKPAPN
jgi:tetratricopeptide (TPR) repeat protein